MSGYCSLTKKVFWSECCVSLQQSHSRWQHFLSITSDAALCSTTHNAEKEYCWTCLGRDCVVGMLRIKDGHYLKEQEH